MTVLKYQIVRSKSLLELYLLKIDYLTIIKRCPGVWNSTRCWLIEMRLITHLQKLYKQLILHLRPHKATYFEYELWLIGASYLSKVKKLTYKAAFNEDRGPAHGFGSDLLARFQGT